MESYCISNKRAVTALAQNNQVLHRSDMKADGKIGDTYTLPDTATLNHNWLTWLRTFCFFCLFTFFYVQKVMS